MNGTIVAAALSGTAMQSIVIFLWKRVRGDPKAQAETRKSNAEAHRLEWQTLRDEIERQAHQVQALRNEIKDLKDSFISREAELLHENKQLRFEVSSLRRRVGQLEEIIKTKTTPEDMRAQLAEIDRRTANGG